MTKRIRNIFILVSISIIGLMALQLYWNIKTYTINKAQLTKEVDLALQTSIGKEMTLRYAKEVKRLFPEDTTEYTILVEGQNKESDLDSISELLKQKNQTSTISYIYKYHIDSNRIKEKIKSKSSPDKRINEIIAKLLSSEEDSDNKIQLQYIDSIFSAELSERNIIIEYYLELYDNKTKEVIERTSEKYSNENNITLSDTYVTVNKKRSIRLICTNWNQIILYHIGWSGLLSILLFILVMVCFVYMLTTIFKQKQLSEIKNDFINNMTHELKTPISTVSAIVESMQSFGVLEDKEKAQKYLALSKKELTRLSGLVEKVLNMAREEKAPAKMVKEKISLTEMCNNIKTGQHIKQNNKKVTLYTEIQEDANHLYADRFHINNVLQNLVENSIKYSNDDVEIFIKSTRIKKHIYITVSDNGIGIPHKYQAKIFDKFYRVPTGDIHNVKGFGLGLHYVKSIIEKHQGRIEIKSEVNKGTTFTIILPS